MSVTAIRPVSAPVVIMRTPVVAMIIMRRWHRTAWRMAFIPPAMVAPAITIPVIAARAACAVMMAAVAVPPARVTPVVTVPVITAVIPVTDIDRKARRIQAEAAGLHGRRRRREQGKEQCCEQYRL
ncbi:hypothetical protein D3C80_1753530 [compost metagenome]